MYSIKLCYFNLQKEHIKTLKENLIAAEFYETIKLISIIESKIEDSIESTLKELKELKNTKT